ncbi:unnamed protein product [Musa textilis]
MAFMGKLGPLLGMIYVQVAYAAMFLITRLAFTRGMSHYSFVLYRQIIAAMAICPLACFLDKICISQNFYYAGLAYTSSTFVGTMNNLQPVVTFLLAYLLRYGKAVSIPWVWAFSTAACVVAQYPSQLTLSGLVNLIGGLQCAVISLSFEKPAALKLRWDLQLLSIAYSGIFCAGFGMFAVMWCVKETGPVYVTAFGPMSAVMVAILEPLLLHVQLTWSSLIGLVMVIGGLFLFLWGKAQDSSGTGEAFAATHGVGEWDRNEASVYEEEPSNQEPLLA